LRERGYVLAPMGEDGALSLIWIVNRLIDGSWFLVVNLSDGFSFSRVYPDLDGEM
jgi:hypothetical protein